MVVKKHKNNSNVTVKLNYDDYLDYLDLINSTVEPLDIAEPLRPVEFY